MGCNVSALISKGTAKLSGDLDENGVEIQDKKVLLVGLENSGKTSILIQLKESQFLDTVPTIGLNVEQIRFRSYSLTMWDVGGQATKLWKHYFDHIDAIIFVVDSVSNDVRLEKSKKEIQKLTKDSALENVPILLMLNK